MNKITSTSLPEPIAQYIDAANRFDTAGAAGCFAPDAIVRDEQKEHVGRAAIEQWIAQTSQAFQPHVTATSTQSVGANVKMVGFVTGNFPGSPVNLDYDFSLQNGKISLLTIR